MPQFCRGRCPHRAAGPWVCKNGGWCGSTSAPGFAEQVWLVLGRRARPPGRAALGDCEKCRRGGYQPPAELDTVTHVGADVLIGPSPDVLLRGLPLTPKPPLSKGGREAAGGFYYQKNAAGFLFAVGAGPRPARSEIPICSCKTVGAAHRAARIPFSLRKHCKG